MATTRKTSTKTAVTATRVREALAAENARLTSVEENAVLMVAGAGAEGDMPLANHRELGAATAHEIDLMESAIGQSEAGQRFLKKLKILRKLGNE